MEWAERHRLLFRVLGVEDNPSPVRPLPMAYAEYTGLEGLQEWLGQGVAPRKRFEVEIPVGTDGVPRMFVAEILDGQVAVWIYRARPEWEAEMDLGRPCCGGTWDTYHCQYCDGMDIPPQRWQLERSSLGDQVEANKKETPPSPPTPSGIIPQGEACPHCGNTSVSGV